MKLDEITQVPPQTEKRFDINDFDLENGEHVAEYEGKDIIHYTTQKNPSTHLYAIVEDQQIIAALVADQMSLYGDQYLVIGRTWVQPQHRRKGRITALYLGLTNKLGHKLVSDREQTPATIELWKSLQKHASVMVLDTEAGQVLDRSQVNDQQIYDDTDKYRLVAQQHKPNISPVGEGVLKEYIVVTHPNNDGEYL